MKASSPWFFLLALAGCSGPAEPTAEISAPPIEPAPVEVAPVEVAPVEVAPVEVAPVDGALAPADGSDASAPDATATAPDATAPDAAVAGVDAPGEGAPVQPPASGVALTVPNAAVPPGTGVKLSGTLSYSGGKKGVYRVDISKVSAKGVPTLVQGLTLSAPGRWEVEIPNGFGHVSVMAYVDADGKGPSPTDPWMSIDGVGVKTKVVANLDVTPVDGGKAIGTMVVSDK